MKINSSLQKIFIEIPEPFSRTDLPDVRITGISIDSRAVQPGHLFVAMKGGSSDGHDYIQNAIENAAAAVVGEQDLNGLAVPYIRLENTRPALT
jgi:UDP-N-acetylmuramoyl-L-alanyl-D-glutamate--2,6-diaminopimelate ligase